MLIRPTISQSPSHPQPLSLPNPINFPFGFRNSTPKKPQFSPFIITNSYPPSSSVSKVYSYGTVDYEKNHGTLVAWKAIYKRISAMGNPEKGPTGVLNQWENEGKQITKWELCRLVKELRKFGRHKLALEVYEWMNNRAERFRSSTSDAAIQLDLVSKVHGVAAAEAYFAGLPNGLLDNRVYGALLNAYARARAKAKAESLLAEMKARRFAGHTLPYNVMMTLYMNLGDHANVEALVLEMTRDGVGLDLYSYNIWISSRGARGGGPAMEDAYRTMRLDGSVNPNWTTYSTMATVYIRRGDVDKAEECLGKIEGKITGRDRIPYHYLLSHYGSIRKKDEVRRIWDSYKTIFSYIPNLGYHTVISSFVRMGDIREAEDLYDEWLSVKSTFDPRIGNLLLGWYVRNGASEKSDVFLREMVAAGKPNSSTWEIVAERYVGERRVSDALSCLRKAVSAGGAGFWRPKPANVSSIYEICDRERDEKGKDELFRVLRDVGVLEDEVYMSKVPCFKVSLSVENEKSKVKVNEVNDGDDGGTIPNGLEMGF